MKTSEALYAAADYIREHGFCAKMGVDGCPRCMYGAITSATLDNPERDWPVTDYFRALFTESGGQFDADVLEREGWTKRDAIAALEIAADYASAEGR